MVKEVRIFNSLRAQVWVETVIYTLIGLAIMGAIIAISTPKIIQMNDNILITQTIESLNTFNEQVRETLLYPGNQREILLTLKKGEYTLDAGNNTFYFTLKNTRLKYSEPGKFFKDGDIYRLTLDKGNNQYDILLLLNYSLFDVTYFKQNTTKIFTPAPLAYRLLVVNRNGKNIDIEQL